MRFLAAKLAALALIISATVQAKPPVGPGTPIFLSGMTGNEMMKVCPTTFDPGLHMPCTNYLMGLIDGLKFGGTFCAPRGVTYQQLERIVYNAVRDHPEKWHYHVLFLGNEALSTAFPCR